MQRNIYRVDAFTDVPYGGNPAGVMPDATGLTSDQMQLIAKEMQLSETAFVFPGKAGYDFRVRFFTPAEEVDLCGHATIAAFSLLKELGHIEKNCRQVIQKTNAGVLAVEFEDDGSVLMEQGKPVRRHSELPLSELCAALNLNPNAVGLGPVMEQPEIWSTGLADILLPLQSVAILKALAPSMAELSNLSQALAVVGVHAFALDEQNRLWCRNFAPACGIPEESATGTSNGALGACLYSKGWGSKDSLTFIAHQGDWLNRPSRILVQVTGGDPPIVRVGGRAVTVLIGRIALPFSLVQLG